jgi:FkbM family methyltransferase
LTRRCRCRSSSRTRRRDSRTDTALQLRRILPGAARDVGSRLLNDASAIRELGPSGFRALRAAQRDPHPDTLTRFTARSLEHPFWIRHGTTDASEFIHTVCRRTYDCRLPPRPRWIIDLGANVGDSAAWFLSKYPGARVIALEPDPANHALAARNLALYGDRVVLLRAAIWSSDGEVSLNASASWPSGTNVGGGEGTARCRALSMPTLLREHGITEIDVLKCDIEGAEDAVFAADPDPWLSRTRVLSSELHSPACAAVVSAAAARCGFRLTRHRELTVFWKA